MYRILKKLSVVNISIILFILICFIFAIYYINNLLPKKLNISNANIIEDSLNVESYDINVGKLISTVKIRIKLNEKDKKEYVNYTVGAGENYYLNYKIVIETGDKKYGIKTFLTEKNEYDEIELTGYFMTSAIKDCDYTLGILQQDYEIETKNKYENYYFIGI